MKKLFSLVSMSLLVLAGMAQGTFQKIINVQGVQYFISTSVHQCADGSYILGGFDGYGSNGYIIKLSSSFQTQWVQTLTDPANYLMKVYQVGETAGGGYYALGQSWDNNTGVYTCFLVKMDNAGNFTMTQQYDMPNTDMPYWCIGPKAKQLPSGDFIISTGMWGSAGIIHTDVNGNILTAMSFRGDTTEPKNPALDVINTSDGGILLAGKRGDCPFLVKLDAAGNTQWCKSFQVTDYYNRIYTTLQTPDGGYLMAGLKTDSMGSTGYKGFLLKIFSNGNIDWYKEYSNPSQGFYFTDIRKLSTTDYLLFGQDEVLGFAVVAVLDANGVVHSAKSVGAPGAPSPYLVHGMDITALDEMLFTYTTYDSAYNALPVFMGAADQGFWWCDANNYSLTENAVNYSPTVNSTIFTQAITLSQSALPAPTSNSVVTLSNYCLSSGISENPVHDISIFPNPFTSSTTLELDPSVAAAGAAIVLYDVLGKEVKRVTCTGEKTEIVRGNLPAGMYLYRVVSNGTGIASGKLIIE